MGVVVRKSKVSYFFCCVALASNIEAAEGPYWWPEATAEIHYSSAVAACQAWVAGTGLAQYLNYMRLRYDYFGPGDYREGQLGGAYCFTNLGIRGMNFVKGDCATGSVFNNVSGECEVEGTELSRKSIGKPNGALSCNAPSLSQGNPINVATGNKFQDELDYFSGSGEIEFHRYYNSLGISNPSWSHTYSVRLVIDNESIQLIRADGWQSYFSRVEGGALAENTDLGTLIVSGNGWKYFSQNGEVMDFDSLGRLVGWARPNKSAQTISYSDGSISVSDDFGDQLTLTVDQQGQVMSLQANGVSIVYSYRVAGQLVKVSSVRGSSSSARLYSYEDDRNILLLTGITDERGVRYATWSYDDKKRALTSEHGVGTERVDLAFNEDGSTTVTNSLGKKATYQFQLLQGVKRIISIHGDASDNCPLSNSSFTYDFRGQIQTATDAKGLVTTYSYNDRGLEVSRTEASGTPLARTTTTEWDPSRFLKTKVVEPTRTTLYTYDVQGRLLSRQAIPN